MELAVGRCFVERSVDSLAALESNLEHRRGGQPSDIVPFEVDHAGRGRVERDSTSVQRFDLTREPIAVFEQRDVALGLRDPAGRERHGKECEVRLHESSVALTRGRDHRVMEVDQRLLRDAENPAVGAIERGDQAEHQRERNRE